MSEPAVAEKPAGASLKAILGQKVGMTQLFGPDGHVIPVTVVQAGPCHVMQVMTPEKHGYAAIQVSYGAVREKAVNKPRMGQFKKRNLEAARWIRELRTDKASSFTVGQVLKVDGFSAGDYVDVTGDSKGKGFAGAMKRHNFQGGPSTHGQSDRARAPGSSGSNTYPGRVFKGKRFPGHLGAERVTTQHLEIVKVDPDKNLLLIRGAVPGSKESLIVVEETVKRVKHRVIHHAEGHKKAKKDTGAKPAAAATPAAKGKAAK